MSQHGRANSRRTTWFHNTTATRVRNCGTPDDPIKLAREQYTCGDTVLVAYSDERQELAADPWKYRRELCRLVPFRVFFREAASFHDEQN